MRLPRWFNALWVLLLTILIVASAWAEPWRFGVMGDTQWTVPDDGKSPNGVPVGVITQINEQFIKAGVKFVVQVGDLVETYSDAALDTRSRAAQDLCSAGIGFYPLRGNHEPTQAAAQGFQVVFPQTQGNGPCVHGARNFTSPSPNLKGLSYSFDYNSVRFVLLDQFTRTDGSGTSVDNNMLDQLTWIDSALAGRPAPGHAFVFGHKNLIGENHPDVLFGANPGQNLAAQEQFIRSLKSNEVHYYVSAHDHIHQRSLISSPVRVANVQEIITACASSKFYIPLGNAELPGTINNDAKYDNPPRETSIAQERNAIGYYIYMVDGPRVTVEYYSAAANSARVKDEYIITKTPTLTFTKRESFGYSLNGKEFLIAQGRPYTDVQDRSPFAGTHARILSGRNQSSATDGSGRPFTKAVDTGWDRGQRGMASDIFSLWGMGRSLGSDETDAYTLAMTYDQRSVNRKQLKRGLFGLVTMNKNGRWVNAVEKDFGGNKHFVFGPWRPGYGLGTYGVDPHTHTAWAILNYVDGFAVARFQVDTRR